MKEVLTRKQIGNRFVYEKTTEANWELNKTYMSAEGWSLVPEKELIPVMEETPKVEPVAEEIEPAYPKKKSKYQPKTVLIEGIEQEQEKPSEDDL
jgi:hypothetical protein